jgi:hypothetical protein
VPLKIAEQWDNIPFSPIGGSPSVENYTYRARHFFAREKGNRQIAPKPLTGTNGP